MQDYMMPETIKQTRRVEIYHVNNKSDSSLVVGFKFFVANETLIFEKGMTSGERKIVSVTIGEDEQIIGVKYKSSGDCNINDLQFMVCKRI